MEAAWILCVIVNAAVAADSRRSQYENQLRKIQARGIDSLVPPFPSDRGPITVRLNFNLHQVIKLNADSATLSVSGKIRLAWTDDRYKWTGDPPLLLLPAQQLWIPQIALSTSADFGITFGNTSNNEMVMVNSDGLLMIEKTILVHVACDVDVHFFPRDAQKCIMRFRPPLIYLSIIALKWEPRWNRQNKLVFGEEWRLLAIRHFVEKASVVAPNGTDVQSPVYMVRMLLYRNYAFYFLTIIIPTVMLSLVTLVPYILPPTQNGQKLVIPISTFLSFNIYMLLLEKSLPKAASIPVLGQCYAVFMAVCILTEIMQTISVKFYTCRLKTVPRPIAILYLRYLAGMCCYRLCHGQRHFEVEVDPEADDKATKVQKAWITIGRVNDRVGLFVSVITVFSTLIFLFVACYMQPVIPDEFLD